MSKGTDKMDWSTFEIAAWSLGIKLLTCGVGLCFIHYMMRLYDRTDGVDSKGAFDLVEKDPRAVADYYGWRVLAFCVLVGLILS